MEHLWKVVFLIVLFVFVPRWLWSQETKTKLALLKYKGGGDWYANPTSLPNLIRFCNDKLGTDLAKEPATVEPGSRDIFNYPYVHMTGHGNVVLQRWKPIISGSICWGVVFYMQTIIMGWLRPSGGK